MYFRHPFPPCKGPKTHLTRRPHPDGALSQEQSGTPFFRPATIAAKRKTCSSRNPASMQSLRSGLTLNGRKSEARSTRIGWNISEMIGLCPESSVWLGSKCPNAVSYPEVTSLPLLPLFLHGQVGIVLPLQIFENGTVPRVRFSP